jgi:hypothetical protein
MESETALVFFLLAAFSNGEPVSTSPENALMVDLIDFARRRIPAKRPSADQ